MQSNEHGRRIGAVAGGLLFRAGLAATLAVLALPLALFAHAHLRRSEPSAQEKLVTPPSALRFWFSERPELSFTRVRLRAADSSEIALGSVTRMSDDPMGVSVPITATLVPGTYTVLWRTAAADGHATSGSFTFEIAGAAAPVVTNTDSMARPGTGHALVRVDSTERDLPSLNTSAATRWLEFMAMIAVVGAVVFRLVVLPRATFAAAGALPGEARAEIADSARRLAQSALILLFITALSRLYAEARAVLGPDRRLDGAALRAVIGTSWGTGWLVGIAGVIVAAVGFTVVRRARSDVGWNVAALGALGIAISPALTGHAGSTAPVALSIGADVLHVLAACAWLGTLLALLFAALPLVRGARSRAEIGSGPLVAAMVRAFHPVALTCAGIVVATGLISAWLRLSTLASLWESTYGRVLLIKLAFVAIVVVLGALNWRRVLPMLGDERGARRITRTASVELTIAALVLAVTAVLVSTSPPDRAIAPAALSVTR